MTTRALLSATVALAAGAAGLWSAGCRSAVEDFYAPLTLTPECSALGGTGGEWEAGGGTGGAGAGGECPAR